MINPYAPTAEESDSRASGSFFIRLRWIWVWLLIATLGTMLATPADPIRIYAGMASVLPFFFCGVLFKLHPRRILFIFLFALCFLVAAAFWSIAWIPFDSFYTIAGMAVALGSTTLGVLAARGIAWSRRKIYGGLAASYTIGLILGPLGAVLLTSITLLLVDKSGCRGALEGGAPGEH